VLWLSFFVPKTQSSTHKAHILQKFLRLNDPIAATTGKLLYERPVLDWEEGLSWDLRTFGVSSDGLGRERRINGMWQPKQCE